jgi:hypothetical protein
MKKEIRLLVFVIAFAIISSSLSTMQAQAFKNGDLVGNLGLAFGWYSYAYSATSLPAISLSMEKGITDIENVGPFSIGGIVGFKHASYSLNNAPSDFGWNDIIIAARGAIHYDLFKVSKLDTYGGVALGLRIESYDYYLPNLSGNYEKAHTNYTHGLLAIYVGGRYYFSDRFAGFGELGYGLGYLTLGVSYKFSK